MLAAVFLSTSVAAVHAQERERAILVLDGSGSMRISSEATEGGTSLDDNMFYYVYEAKKTLKASGRK